MDLPWHQLRPLPAVVRVFALEIGWRERMREGRAADSLRVGDRSTQDHPLPVS